MALPPVNENDMVEMMFKHMGQFQEADCLDEVVCMTHQEKHLLFLLLEASPRLGNV